MFLVTLDDIVSITEYYNVSGFRKGDKFIPFSYDKGFKQQGCNFAWYIAVRDDSKLKDQIEGMNQDRLKEFIKICNICTENAKIQLDADSMIKRIGNIPVVERKAEFVHDDPKLMVLADYVGLGPQMTLHCNENITIKREDGRVTITVKPQFCVEYNETVRNKDSIIYNEKLVVEIINHISQNELELMTKFLDSLNKSIKGIRHKLFYPVCVGGGFESELDF